MKKCYLLLTALLAVVLLSVQSVSAGPAQAGRRTAATGMSVPLSSLSLEKPGYRTPSCVRGAQWSSPFYQAPKLGALASPSAQKAPLFAPALDVELRGVINYDSNLQNSGKSYEGVYEVPVNAVGPLNEIFLNNKLVQGTWYHDGKLYGYQLFHTGGVVLGATLAVIDAETGVTLEEIPTSQDYQVLTSTYVPALKAAVCYATVVANGTYALIKVDDQGNVTKLTDVTATDYVGGLAVDAAGVLWGLSTTGRLATIDTTTWRPTMKGETGIDGKYISAMVYEPVSGLLLTSSSPQVDCIFYSIDPATAVATERFKWDHIVEFSTLYIPEVNAPAGAPAAVTDLAPNFANGSLTGTIDFIAPATTFAGTAGSGAMTYHVMTGATELATGQATWGNKVSAPVTIPEKGNVSLYVYCSNSEGDGPKSRLSFFAGPDQPSPVASVAAIYADGKFTVSWPAAEAANGGYIDASKVTYKVSRVAGAETTVVAEATTALSLTDAYAEPANGVVPVSYNVDVVYEGKSTGAIASPVTVLGVATPPYSPDLSSALTAKVLTFIDNNQDSHTWRYISVNGKGTMNYFYDAYNAADDYLVLPATYLEKDKVYYFTFKAGCQNGANYENVAAFVGKAPTAEGLSNNILPSTEVRTTYGYKDGVLTAQNFECSFSPQESGIYYFAIQACSPADRFMLNVTDIEISAPVGTGAPGLVTGLTLTPDPTGAEKVTVNFVAPKVNLAGTTLTSLDKVEVRRNGQLVKTLNPAVGANVEFVDENTGSGNTTYSVTAINAEGSGRPVSATVFVGISEPAAPESASVKLGSDDGEVVISWTPVAYDIHGIPLTDVTYTVAQSIDGKWTPIADDLTGTSAAIRVCDADAAQSFQNFAVFAKNSKGNGAGAITGVIAVGASYTMPFFESFQLKNIVGITVLKGDGAQWKLVGDTEYTNVSTQDGDNRMVCFSATAPGDQGRLFTGRVMIDPKATEPAFNFYYFGVSGNQNTILPMVNEGNGYVAAGKPITIANGTNNQWNRVSVPLSQYSGKAVQLALQVTVVNGAATFIDNMSVTKTVERDLAVSLSTAEEISEGQNLSATVKVSNLGNLSYASGSYSVEFIVNHEVVATKRGFVLGGNASTTLTFNYPVPAMGPDTLDVWARVVTGTDADWENNFSEHAIVTVLQPAFPAVDTLEGNADAQGVTLTWSAPDYASYKAQTTFDFEDCDSFATASEGNIGGWTFLDLDGRIIGGFNNITLPNITIGQPNTFFIFDGSVPSIVDSGYAHTFRGHNNSNKYLAAMFNYDSGQNDDWAISPELSGDAQVISFYARAYNADYPESLEMLYSTTDRDTNSFVSVKTVKGITTDANYGWTRYEFEVPAGAKYFALRFVSADTFMIMIDDVTFAGVDAKPVTLEGYNVYRNGVKLNDKPITETTFRDPETVADARYVVSAVYNVGESKASNPVYPNGNGVDGIGAGMVVRGLTGAIEVSGVAEATVIDMQGRVLYSGSAGRIAAAPGAYIVRSGRRSIKVLVK